MSAKPISYQPTDGLSYNPTEDKYWDSEALKGELTRVFEICHGCRMCFKYCDSFPTLFSLLDNHYDGDVTQVTDDDTRQIMDACFQCKLCDVQCPYTPRDKHEYQLDFPKLVHRFDAQRVKREGVTVRERVLGSPDEVAEFARLSLGMANAMNKVNAHRVLMEKALGIHRDKLLPDFASQTFEKWATDNDKTRPEPQAEVALFATCYVQNNEPEIGKDTMEVFEANSVDIAVPTGQVCCGMPAWEHGDLDTLRAQAHTNLGVLLPYVDRGAKVAVINPTCSMMMRREYPELLAGDDRVRAQRLAKAVVDPGEFLWSIRRQERFNADFKSTPNGPVSYHTPCHLRAQAVGFKGRDLLRKIPGVTLKTVMECCGHDGTYAMTVEGFEPSQRIGSRAFDEMQEDNAEVWSTECPLAAKQFEQFAGRKPMHPMSILARALREDGFEKTLPDEEDS